MRAVPAGTLGAANGHDSDGFTVRSGDPAAADDLAAFETAARNGAWDKAFSAISRVIDSPTDAMVRGSDGFYLSTHAHARHVLVGLPPAGREAYRLFNDAAARSGLAQIDSPEQSDGAPNQIARLQGLFDRYFITSVGDQIADRLGDAKFESGDFVGAANSWAAIRSDYPDTSLSPARIMAKRAIALARAEQWEELRIAASALRERYADQSVVLGGRDVTIASLVDGLLSSPLAVAHLRKAEPAAAPNVDLLPRKGTQPSWQMVFLDDTLQTQIARIPNPRGLSGINSIRSIVPGAAAAGDRVFLNWLGIGVAIDGTTGKLLWRSEAFSTVPLRLQQAVLSGYDSGEGSISVLPGGERLLLANASTMSRQVRLPAAALGLVVAARPGAAQQMISATLGPGSGVLTCLAAADGKTIWSSETSTDLTAWSILGQPLIAENTAYAVATRVLNRSTEITLLAISLANGAVSWDMTLGSLGTGMNGRVVPVAPKAAMLRDGEKLYILTGNGGLLAVNLSTRRIDWAYSYDVASATTSRLSSGYGAGGEGEQFGSSMQLSGSLLLFKERGSNMMYALDTSAPSLKWRRRIDSDKAIIAADSSMAYVLGDDLNGIDLATREMLWSARTPLGSRQFQPLVHGSKAYVFGTDGLHGLDLQRGSSEIFSTADRGGGAVLQLGDRMICVSNHAVTAYPLSPGPTTQP
ncbi:MAG TPA: PQQ-binding-like beta-propeller repeat protein [Humisphaera sp.]|nr:PQQ-binding-like beta-propeller repeat protein [Humisphaera sp.]